MRGVTSTITPDVFFVYPPFENPPLVGGRYCTSPPLGTAYVAAVLEEKGFCVEVTDCNVGEVDVEELAQRIISSGAGILGISVTSPGLRFSKRLIDELRAKSGGNCPKIVCGGAHISADIKSSMLLGADTYFRGESEYCFAEYCAGQTQSTGVIECGLIEDINTVPYPARHLFKGKYRFTAVSASRGCPFNCIFCGMANTRYRKRTPQNIKGEIEQLRSQKIKAIDFVDDSFTIDRPFTREISEIMSSNRLRWSCTTRADLVDRQLLSEMRKSGCTHISFGVESKDEGIRQILGKNISNRQYEKVFRWCKDEGIKTRAYAIVGTPFGENPQETFEYINTLDPDEAVYSPLILYPNTEAFRKAVYEGVISEDIWCRYLMGEVPLPTYLGQGHTLESINKSIYDESEQFYLSPKRIWKRMKAAQSTQEVLDAFKAAAIYLTKPIIH